MKTTVNGGNCGGQRSRFPDLNEALEILNKHGVPENVVRHSIAVAAVAFSLGEKLREKGIAVDTLLVHRAALLHDLDKIAAGAGRHGECTAEILDKLGYPELGEIAKTHVLRPEKLPKTWEEKLVFLADKLVEGEEVVGISARLSALRARYPEFQEEITAAEPFVRALQNEILRALEIDEPALLAELRKLESRHYAAWASRQSRRKASLKTSPRWA